MAKVTLTLAVFLVTFYLASTSPVSDNRHKRELDDGHPVAPGGLPGGRGPFYPEPPGYESPIAEINMATEEMKEGMEFMQKYGYLKVEDMGEEIASISDVSAAIKLVQYNYGLRMTGKMDESTLEAMRRPRCGITDVIANFQLSGTKWEKNHITYRIENFTPYLTEREVRDTVREAFGVWSDYTPLTFSEVRDPQRTDVDILVEFVSGDHSDNSPFDGRYVPSTGRGQQLAHAFQPPRDSYTYRIDGDSHFDGDEEWTLNTARGVNLYIVAIHEFGHALGISHTPILGAIMFPAYVYQEEPCMHPDDKAAIQELYGAQEVPNPRLPMCNLAPERCNTPEFDATLRFRGELFFFKDEYWFRVNGRTGRISGPDPVRHFWADLPEKLDAAYERVSDGKLFFFSGDRYWEYDGTTPEAGNPRPISDFGLPVSNIDAALPWRPSGKTYFFKGDQYWRYDEENARMDDGYPRPLAVWRGLRSLDGVDAVFEGPDGDDHSYFFKDGKYWKYSEKLYRIARGYRYGKDIATEWLGC
ncbi:PREDICTED: 72 kDa type IV collagenase-like [Branchiostoma belcheri]|uniref:72 kDa type IV collagenase-like n=1 Tax=Branchiostoma belcheri TaxID=7741 RepID=A0A6P5AP26_BRABE|nr:PREDICTED: 72 kDa type IV collagenase-like [Branchiostoma belcheri]XP_019644838.1 PREDICTED: 72 kDa type IV collagenase-like [Branchiostoma belcheri]